MLKNADHMTRVNAVDALAWHFGPAAAREVLPLLEDPDVHTRSIAARTLGMCGNNSLEVISKLEALLGDDADIVRIDAALAISRLECPRGGAARMLPQLIAGLANPDRQVAIVWWLRTLGTKAAPAVPALLQALESPDADVRMNIPITLACTGETARVALPRLRELQATDPEPSVRENAARAIGAMESAREGQPIAWWCR